MGRKCKYNIQEIANAWNNGISTTELAKTYNTTKGCMSTLICNWRKNPNYPEFNYRNFKEYDVEEVHIAWDRGDTLKDMVKQFNFPSIRSVYRWIEKKRREGYNFIKNRHHQHNHSRNSNYDVREVALDWNDGMMAKDMMIKHGFPSKSSIRTNICRWRQCSGFPSFSFIRGAPKRAVENVAFDWNGGMPIDDLVIKYDFSSKKTLHCYVSKKRNNNKSIKFNYRRSGGKKEINGKKRI